MWLTLAAHADRWRIRDEASRARTRAEIATLARKGSLDPLERSRLETMRHELAASPPAWNRPQDVFGRLRPGVPLAEAEAEVAGFARELAAERGQAPERLPPSSSHACRGRFRRGSSRSR